MLILVVIFIGVSILFYTLLGGADFGAGIIEIFSGKKGINIISKAIAPVWEVNHIWLIVVIVILFNAFPEVYSTMTLVLHIPLLLVLIGIIFRGTAFSFRYYDPFRDRSHDVFTFVFKLFSVFTPLFLGVNLGAVMLGRITLEPGIGFVEKFVDPWFNIFSFTMGVFTVLLFTFHASVFLIGETNKAGDRAFFKKYARRLLVLLVFGGLLVFLTARWGGLALLNDFIHSPVSLTCLIIASLLIPVIWVLIDREKVHLLRVAAGAQTTMVIGGWFAAQFPVMVRLDNAEDLTIYNTIAPDKTLLMLLTALIIGLLLVIPLLVYLFKVFKFSGDADEALE